MYCSHCGVRASGNFCSACGSALADQELAPLSIDDWSQEVHYDSLMRVPAVREQIARSAAAAKKKITGEQFLELCDKAFQPLAGIPLSSVAAFVQPIYRKMGIRTGKSCMHTIAQPTGHAIVAVLCSLARRGQSVQQVTQLDDGCVIVATLPSDPFAFEGDLRVVVRRAESGTRIEAEAQIHGQLYDWGKSRRCLDHLLQDVQAPAKAA